MLSGHSVLQTEPPSQELQCLEVAPVVNGIEVNGSHGRDPKVEFTPYRRNLSRVAKFMKALGNQVDFVRVRRSSKG